MEQKIKQLKDSIRRHENSLATAPEELQGILRETLQAKKLELKMMEYNLGRANKISDR